MKIEKLKKKYNFTEENLERIQNSVAEAEKNTEGEIVVAITSSSSFYILWEVFFSFLLSLFVVAILVPFSQNVSDFLAKIFWRQTKAYEIPLFLLLVQLASFLVFYLIANIPFVDRLIVPHSVMQKYVQNKALRQFVLSDICSTEKRSGILIFISVLEKRVQIVCDKGILNCTTQEEWNLLASELAKGFSSVGKNSTSSPTTAIVNTIEKCGSLFKKSFPLADKDENPNELDNGIVFVEGGEL